MSEQAPTPLMHLTSDDERQFLNALAEGHGPDRHAARRAQFILALMESGDIMSARKVAKMTAADARKWIAAYNVDGWKGLLTIGAPRGGDFLARYDNGYWAERLVMSVLDSDQRHRAIPYGTSRSEPFSDVVAFRNYSLTEFALQAWSAHGRLKRPDLLSVPRSFLIEERDNDLWTPDLKHWNNVQCESYVRHSIAAYEVETSLWAVERATGAAVKLSFTVKDEDLEALKRWVRFNRKPLYIVQVFFDQAYVLPFSTLLNMIKNGDIKPQLDKKTNKQTYYVPISQGHLIGRIPTPDVEGRLFIAPNGRVTVYGRLIGSRIVPLSPTIIAELMAGKLG